MPEGDDPILPGHVAVARILGAWGVRGDVRVEPLAPAAVLRRGRRVRIAGRETVILAAGPAGRHLRLRLEGIRSRAAAAALRGSYLQVPEGSLDPLPEGHYYRFQLSGLRVIAADGRDLGEVSDVLSTAESDVLVVRGPLGEVLIPATEEVIRSIDLAARTLVIEAVPGLLPDAGE
jgi:16S rRNA processing protein RimM